MTWVSKCYRDWLFSSLKKSQSEGSIVGECELCIRGNLKVICVGGHDEDEGQ